MRERFNHLILLPGLRASFLTSLIIACFAAPMVSGGDSCSITGPEFTNNSSQYRETLLDLERQVQYAKKNAVRDALIAAGLDSAMIDFIPPKSMEILSRRASLDTQAATQVATANGYHPTRALPDITILSFATENANDRAHTPVAPPSHVYEVDGVKITLDVADYGQGTFKSHPTVEINAHPRENSYANLAPEIMIDRALSEYKQANPAGIPLSIGDNPVFYRVVSKAELVELLGTGQSRANGSITDWSKDFVTSREKAWLESRKIYENGMRDLGRPDLGNKSPAQIASINADFRAQFGRDLPPMFLTQAQMKDHFVDHLKDGLAKEIKQPGTKERLPAATYELIDRFSHNGVLNETALGRYIEDNILSLPPGSRRNDAVLDLFGYDYAAYLHAQYTLGFDQFSPFKGTSIGLPVGHFIKNDTYVIAIRDVHGRARKNLGGGGEREWFYKDGIALDEVAGVWSGAELSTIPNGNIMMKAPEFLPRNDPAHKVWDQYVQKDYHLGITGDPTPIQRPAQ
ncbi:MAG: hypothetical protein AABY86_02110 [Bdellovibrionota bacterium]